MTELMAKPDKTTGKDSGGRFGKITKTAKRSSLSGVQKRYLERGLSEPGGKLPLFDKQGQRIKDQTIKACIKNGWCEPWYHNPVKPDWLVCKLTPQGRSALKAK